MTVERPSNRSCNDHPWRVACIRDAERVYYIQASGGDENDSAHCHGAVGDAKRPRRKSSKRSELELLLQLDGGLLAASAEFRKVNALRPRDNVLAGFLQPPPRPSADPPVSHDDVSGTSLPGGPLTTVYRTEERS